MPLIQASVVTGFEVVAASETEQKLGVPCLRARGRVRFEVSDEDVRKVLSLRSIDNAFHVILDQEVPGLRDMTKEDALNCLGELINDINWNDMLHIWRLIFGRSLQVPRILRQQGDQQMNSNQNENISTKFRVTCGRAGSKEVHSFSSDDAAKSFGSRVNEATGWKADMTNFDVEIVLKIDKDWVTIMTALTPISLFKRNVVAFGPTTMRATMCYSLIALSRPSPGAVILDPMCGGGSIPIEGALAFPECVFYGTDNNEKAIERCHENKIALKFPSNPPMFIRSDATDLPMKENFFDAIVTDLPFGKKIGSVSDNRVLYPKLLMEWSRVAKVEAMLVVLTHDKRSWEGAVMKQKMWRPLESRTINVGGLSTLGMILSRNPS